MILKEDIVNKYKEYKKLCEQLAMDFTKVECYNSRHYSNDFVIDENKSVKWNREEVQRRKQQYLDLQKSQNEIKYNALKEVEDMTKDYIQQIYDINDKKYSDMLTFMRENDEDTYNYTNGIGNKIEYLLDLAELITD